MFASKFERIYYAYLLLGLIGLSSAMPTTTAPAPQVRAKRSADTMLPDGPCIVNLQALVQDGSQNITEQVNDLNDRTDSMKSAAADIRNDVGAILGVNMVAYISGQTFFEDKDWTATEEVKEDSITNTIETLRMLRNESFNLLGHITYIRQHWTIGDTSSTLKEDLLKLENDLSSAVCTINIALANLQVIDETNGEPQLSETFLHGDANYTYALARVYILMGDIQRFMQYQNDIYSFMYSSYTTSS